MNRVTKALYHSVGIGSDMTGKVQEMSREDNMQSIKSEADLGLAVSHCVMCNFQALKTKVAFLFYQKGKSSSVIAVSADDAATPINSWI
jgi:hypothetical protein